MNEIMEKTYELIDTLDNSNIIKELLYYKNKIINNNNLLTLINKYNNTEDKYIKLDIKNSLYQNKDYKNYQLSYQELSYIIMNINSKYQHLFSKRCHKWEL